LEEQGFALEGVIREKGKKKFFFSQEKKCNIQKKLGGSTPGVAW